MSNLHSYITNLKLNCPMLSLLDKIKTNEVIISDGAWGTFLMAKGLQPGECPELWNIEHPEKVEEIAQSYIEVGAQIVKTNSFGGNAIKLNNYGLAHRCFELNMAAAAISRKAAGKNIIVMGSVGPTGKFLITEEVTPEELYNAFKDQCKGLEAGGADVILVETMTDLEEAKIAILAAKENTHCEVVCTMTFDRTADNNFRSMMGVSPTQMTEELCALGITGLGANCGNGIDGMIHITKEIREANAEVPVIIHANAGMPVYSDGKTVFPESPEMMASSSHLLLKAGANVIGGCCGTSPAHIKKLVEALKK